MCWIAALDYTEPSLLMFYSLGFHDTTVSLFSSHLLNHFFSTCPLNTDIFQGSKFVLFFSSVCLHADFIAFLDEFMIQNLQLQPCLPIFQFATSQPNACVSSFECPTNIWNSTYVKLNTYISFRNLLLLLSSYAHIWQIKNALLHLEMWVFEPQAYTCIYTHQNFKARLLQSVWSVFKGPRKGRNLIPLFLYLKADSVPFQWDLPLSLTLIPRYHLLQEGFPEPLRAPYTALLHDPLFQPLHCWIS